MAIRDVKEYNAVLLNQYLEMKNDLADFDAALEAGYITEDKLASLTEEINNIQINMNRNLYISYLLSLPARKSKQKKFKANQSNKDLETYFQENKADSKAVIEENTNALEVLRAEIKKLKADYK